MKKFKRVISVFLAVLMMMSAMSAFNVAFAAELNEKRENKIIEDVEKGRVKFEEAAKQILEAYSKLINSAKELTVEQKDKKKKIEEVVSDSTKKVSSAVSDSVNSIVKAAENAKKPNANVKAAAGDKAVIAVEKLINDFKGKLAISKPADIDKIKAEDIAAYEEIINAYNALTDAQKDKLDVFAFDKMLKLIYDREQALLLVADPKITANEKTKQAHLNVKNVIGAVPFFANAEKIGAVLENSKSTPQEMLDAYKTSKNEKERIYAGLWNKTKNNFGTNISYSSAAGFVDIVTALEKEALKANPFGTEEPAKVNKPKAKDYPLGDTDPKYIEDLAKYDAYKVASTHYTVDLANYEAELYIAAMEKVANEAAPEFVEIVNYTKTSIEAINAFNANHSDYAKATEALEMFDEMTKNQLAYIANIGFTVYSIYSVASFGPTSKSVKIYGFNKMLNEFEDYKYIVEFEKIVKEVTPPYNQATLTKIMDAYSKVPASYKNDVSAEVMEKYEKIIYEVVTKNQSLDRPDLTGYKVTSVKYPIGVTRTQVATSLPKFDTTINLLLSILGVSDNGLQPFVSQNVYTNNMVATITSMIYKLLGGFHSLVAFSPADLAKKLIEPEYMAAADALNAANTGSDKLANWDNFKLKDGDMFKDGDKDAFIDALSAMFRSVGGIIFGLVLKLENTFSIGSGTYKYGAYEDLVPIFEALDIDAMSSIEYTEYVKNVSATTPHKAVDAKVRPIFAAVCGLIEKIVANPVDELMNLLPKLGYALKTDLIDTQIHALTSKMSFVQLPAFTLKTADIFGMIAPALQNININGSTFSLNLDKDEFLRFVDNEAGCGVATVAESMSGKNAFRFNVESNKADAAVVLFRYLYEEVTSEVNLESYKLLVDNMDKSYFEKLLIKASISALGKMPANIALITLVNFINPPFTY